MELEPRRLIKFVTAFCVVAAAVLGVSGMWSNAAAADLTQLFQDARTQAAQLRRDAVQMESFTRSKLAWRSYADQVETIKAHVNKTGDIVSQIQAARGGAGKRQQEAIDRMVPLLQELASNTTAIIDHLNQTPKHLTDPTYQQYLSANAELATALSQEVSDAVASDNAERKIQKLQDQVSR